MALQLAVESRHTKGKRNNLRLRRAGKVPAILYGHGKDCVPLSVEADTLAAAVRQGSPLVSLTGAVDESAFVRDLQWDTWGTNIVHVDFTRISEHEVVDIRIPIELRGEAPGVREGGIVSQLVHEIEIACPASAIPEKLAVNINNLKLKDSVSLGDLELPQGAKLLTSELEMVIVECIEPQEEPEEEAAEAAPGEPEIIGEKEKEKEKEEDGAKE